MGKKQNKRLELKRFCLSFGVGMMLLTILLFLQNKNSNDKIFIVPMLLSCYHLGVYIFCPDLALPFWTIMKSFFFVITKIISVVVFTIIFYIIITPFAIFIRFLKLDHIDKWEKNDSYWVNSNSKTNATDNVEKLF